MTSFFHIFTLPISRLKICNLNNPNYFLDLFDIKNKFNEYGKQNPSIIGTLHECLELFQKTYEKETIYVDILHSFYTDYLEMIDARFKKIPENPPTIIDNACGIFGARHSFALHDILSGLIIRTIPLIWNGINLSIKNKSSETVYFINLAQIQKMELNRIQDKLFHYAWAGFPDNTLGGYSYGHVAEMIDYIKHVKKIKGDLFYIG